MSSGALSGNGRSDNAKREDDNDTGSDWDTGMGSQDRRGNDNKVGEFFIVLRSPVINHPTPSWMKKN